MTLVLEIAAGIILAKCVLDNLDAIAKLITWVAFLAVGIVAVVLVFELVPGWVLYDVVIYGWWLFCLYGCACFAIQVIRERRAKP